MKLSGSAVPDEDPVDPEILRADGRAQVLPLRVSGSCRRLDRARADVAEAAGHADAVGPDQILVVVVVGVVVVLLGVPFLRGRLVEVGIREQPQADDAGRLAVERADRHVLARARRSPHPDISARSRTDRRGQSGAALVEPRPKRSGSGPVGLVEAGLVDQAEIVPAVVAVCIFSLGCEETSSAGRRRRRCLRS